MQSKGLGDNKRKITDANSSNARKLLALLIIGFCYYIWIRTTGLYIPCMFRLVTGFKCPGCGITTMMVNLSKLNFKAAFIANPFLFITGPFIAAELIYAYIKASRNEQISRTNIIGLYIYISLLLIFGIWRNIVGI